MKDHIFICYRKRDSLAIAGRVYDHLNSWFPDKVHMDVEHSTIQLGQNWNNRLIEVMGQCRVVVAIIGPTWTICETHPQLPETKKDYVTSELQQAISSRLIVIPLLIDGTPIPNINDLPESVRSLQFHQALGVRTAYFPQDILPLRYAICAQCGLEPPTLYEEFLSRIPGMKTVDERTRNTYARASIEFAFFASLGLIVRETYALAFVCGFMAGGTGVVGLNSKRFKILAWLGIFGGIIVMIYSVKLLVLSKS